MTPEEDEAAALDRAKLLREMSGDDQPFIDFMTSRNILHEDLGYIETVQTFYHLDEATRDRLLAHARQDAALAVLNVGSLRKEITALRTQLKRQRIYGLLAFSVQTVLLLIILLSLR